MLHCSSLASISSSSSLQYNVATNVTETAPDKQRYSVECVRTPEVMKEEEGMAKVVVTKPLSLEGDSSETRHHGRVPNLLQRLLSLFSSIRPGSDLTRLQLPPLFNFPKSQLQCYGESVYCTASDLLSKCSKGEAPLERFISVVAWCISTTRPPLFGVAPYNPILGETHHVTRATLNVLLEQVSHHPPVSALHATDEKEGIELLWCQHPAPKYQGTSVEVQVIGRRQLKLLNHGETYTMNSPNLSIRFLPVPGVDWVGNVNVECPETGLAAELCFKRKHLLGLRGNHRAVKGKIFEKCSNKLLYEVDGHWDRTIMLKDKENGQVKLLYDANEVIAGLKTPIVKDAKKVWRNESVAVWGEVSQGILDREWERAREAKKAVEDKQRKFVEDREHKGETWRPKHFTLSDHSNSKEGAWECSPIQKWVPKSAIEVPI